MAKIPTILEAGRADGKLVISDSIFDENKRMFQSEINDIQDTLTSDNSNKPLSAKQGKILKELLDTKVIKAGNVPIDTEPTEGNTTNVVNSDGIYKALSKKVNNITFEERNKNQDEKFAELELKTNYTYGRIFGDNIINIKEVAKGSTIFTKEQIAVGEHISWSFVRTNGTAAIRMLDADGNGLYYNGVIDQYGTTTGQGVEGDTYVGEIVIPNNFDHAIITNWYNVRNLVISSSAKSLVSVVEENIRDIDEIKARGIQDELFTELNCYISAESGKQGRILVHNDFHVTPKIAINKRCKVEIIGINANDAVYGLAFYKEDDTFISGYSNTNDIIIEPTGIPVDASYVRLCKAANIHPKIKIITSESLAIIVYDTNKQVKEVSKIANNTLVDCESIKDSLADLRDLTLTKEAGIANTVGTIQGDSDVWLKHIDISVNVGEKYWFRTKKYPSTGFPVYLFMNGSSVVEKFPNPSTEDSDTYEMDIVVPNNADRLIINSYETASVSLKVSKYGLIDVAKTLDDGLGVRVSKSDMAKYTDVNSAYKDNPNSPISIEVGEYLTEIEGMTSDKYLFGKDRDMVILYNNYADYDRPPLEIAGGVVKYLSFKVDGTGVESSHKSYCVHTDNDACEDKTLIFEDCYFEATENNHCVGVGVRNGEKLVFRNCEFKQNTSGNYCLYLHNGGARVSKTTPSTIIFDNCKFYGVDGCIKLLKDYWNCKTIFEFINNSLYCTSGNPVLIQRQLNDADKTYVDTFGDEMVLSPISHGNNVEVLNL